MHEALLSLGCAVICRRPLESLRVERFMNLAVHSGDDRSSDPGSMRSARRHLREALRLFLA
jgi:hypothetical protein